MFYWLPGIYTYGPSERTNSLRKKSKDLDCKKMESQRTNEQTFFSKDEEFGTKACLTFFFHISTFIQTLSFNISLESKGQYLKTARKNTGKKKLSEFSRTCVNGESKHLLIWESNRARKESKHLLTNSLQVTTVHQFCVLLLFVQNL